MEACQFIIVEQGLHDSDDVPFNNVAHTLGLNFYKGRRRLGHSGGSPGLGSHGLRLCPVMYTGSVAPGGSVLASKCLNPASTWLRAVGSWSCFPPVHQGKRVDDGSESGPAHGREAFKHHDSWWSVVPGTDMYIIPE